MFRDGLSGTRPAAWLDECGKGVSLRWACPANDTGEGERHALGPALFSKRLELNAVTPSE